MTKWSAETRAAFSAKLRASPKFTAVHSARMKRLSNDPAFRAKAKRAYEETIGGFSPVSQRKFYTKLRKHGWSRAEALAICLKAAKGEAEATRARASSSDAPTAGPVTLGMSPVPSVFESEEVCG